MLVSCWSEKSKPDISFTKQIEQQSFLDSNLKTEILIHPKKVNLGSIKANNKIDGLIVIVAKLILFSKKLFVHKIV